MTILRDGDNEQFECENCSHTTEVFDKEDFDAMVTEAKRAGWRIALANGEWTHTCPSCKAGDRLARARRMFGQT